MLAMQRNKIILDEVFMLSGFEMGRCYMKWEGDCSPSRNEKSIQLAAAVLPVEKLRGILEPAGDTLM